MSTSTPNFGFTKPSVNDPTDQDIWGGELNGNFDTLDGALKTARDMVSVSRTATATLSATDRNTLQKVDATSAAVSLTLPSPATVGSGFWVVFKKIDASANTVIILPNAAETIDGGSSLVITQQYDGYWLETDGTNWFIARSQPATPFASTAEAQAGTSTTKAVTPAGLAAAVPLYTYVRAWVRFTLNGTIIKSYNVSSVTNTASGQWLVNFTNALADANYLSIASCKGPNTGNVFVNVVIGVPGNQTPTTTSCPLVATTSNTGNQTATPQEVYVMFID